MVSNTYFLCGGGGKCSHQLRPSGFKIFLGEYNSFYTDHGIVSITARQVRSDGILYWNLAAIRIIEFSIKVKCP